MGKITAYLLIPLYAALMVMGMASFFFFNSQPSPQGAPASYPSNQTINSSFFTNINGFISDINSLGNAITRIAPSQGSALNNFYDLGAFVDTGVAIFHIVADIPLLIGTFFYDVVRLMFSALPVQPNIVVIAMINILLLIPVVYVIMEIVAWIRPPAYVKP